MKGKRDLQKKIEVKDDNSGIEKKDIAFSFKFQITSSNSNISYILMFEWFGFNSGMENQRYDCGLIENWQPIQPDSQMLSFDKNFDIIRVDDAFVKRLANKRFYIYFVNADDQKVKQTLLLDYSSILCSTTHQFSQQFNSLKVQGLSNFSIKLTANKELLSGLYRNYLNPLEIEIINIKDLQQQNQPLDLLPSYIRYNFLNSVQNSHEFVIPAKGKIDIGWGHVFLLGLEDQTKLIEQFDKQPLIIEVHDRDEFVKDNIIEEIQVIDFQKILEEELQRKQELAEQQQLTGIKKSREDTRKGGARGKPAPAPAATQKPPAKDDKSKKKDTKKKDVKIFDPIIEENQIPINDRNFGMAQIPLNQLLNPVIRELKLNAAIVPQKIILNNERNEIELNTTAKKEALKEFNKSTYLDSVRQLVILRINQAAFLAIKLKLAIPIGTFSLDNELNEEKEREQLQQSKYSYQQAIESQQQQLLQQPPVAAKGRIPSAKQKKGQELKQQGLQKDEVENLEKQKELIQQKEKELLEKSKKIKRPVFQDSVYERAIFVVPYKNHDFIQLLQKVIVQINLEALNLVEVGIRALTTYQLTEEEKNDHSLDFIGGFEIIEEETRIYCLEGLAAKGMKRLEEMVPRNIPNCPTFKYLKNKEILFKERLYQEYNLDIRRAIFIFYQMFFIKIRLREKLNNFLQNPKIFLRTRVSENVQKVLIQFAELKKMFNLKMVTQFDLFPTVNNLTEIERKFSNALSEEDILGKEVEVKKLKKRQRMNQDNLVLQTSNNVTIMTQSKVYQSLIVQVNQLQDQQFAADQKSILNIENQFKIQEKDIPESQQMIAQNLKTFNKTLPFPQKRFNNNFIHHVQPFEQLQPDQQVFIYACQTKNFYEMQRQKQRQMAQQDKQNFYTYSENFLSQSINPYEVDEARKQERIDKDSKIISNKLFTTQPHKKYSETWRHPKHLPPSIIDDLHQETWLMQNSKRMQITNSARANDVVVNSSGLEFKNFIKIKDQYFSELQSNNALQENEQKLVTFPKVIKDKPIQDSQQKQEAKPLKNEAIDTKHLSLISKDKKNKQILKRKILSPQTAKFSTIQLSPVSMFFGEKYKGGFLQCTERELDLEKTKGNYDFIRFTKVNPMSSTFMSKGEKMVTECS